MKLFAAACSLNSYTVSERREERGEGQSYLSQFQSKCVCQRLHVCFYLDLSLIFHASPSLSFFCFPQFEGKWAPQLNY